MRELGSLDASPEKGGAPLPTAQSQERPPCDRRAHSVTVFLTPTLRNLGCLTEGAWVGRRNQCFAHRGLSAPAVLERSWTPRDELHGGEWQSVLYLAFSRLLSSPSPTLFFPNTLFFYPSLCLPLSLPHVPPPLPPLFQSLFLSLSHTPPLSLSVGSASRVPIKETREICDQCVFLQENPLAFLKRSLKAG